MGEKKSKKKCCGKCDKKGKFCKNCPIIGVDACGCSTKKDKKKKKKKDKEEKK